MNKTMPRLIKLFVLILSATLVFSGISYAKYDDKSTPSISTVLNVALYPYVPNPDQFKDVVSRKWKSVEPDVSLHFVDWDCYSDDPDSTTDVFVFDTIYLTHFAQKGYLMPFTINEIENHSDIWSFALDGCMNNGVIYGIPQLLCTNLLFYRKGDTKLKYVHNIDQLNKVLGPNNFDEIPLPPNKGLLIDLSGGTTCVCQYLDTLIDVNSSYTNYSVLPDLNKLNVLAIAEIKKIISMAGKEQSQYVPDPYAPYIRASWFANGSGRAYIGYTESMNSFKDKIGDMDFNMLSWAGGCNVPVLYCDAVGISSGIKDEVREVLAKKLANIITAGNTVEECIRPAKGDKYPQYLLPTRPSVYLRLQNDFPVYRKLYNMIEYKPNLYIFRLGSEVREWISSAKTVISKSLGLI